PLVACSPSPSPFLLLWPLPVYPCRILPLSAKTISIGCSSLLSPPLMPGIISIPRCHLRKLWHRQALCKAGWNDSKAGKSTTRPSTVLPWLPPKPFKALEPPTMKSGNLCNLSSVNYRLHRHGRERARQPPHVQCSFRSIYVECFGHHA